VFAYSVGDTCKLTIETPCLFFATKGEHSTQDCLIPEFSCVIDSHSGTKTTSYNHPLKPTHLRTIKPDLTPRMADSQLLPNVAGVAGLVPCALGINAMLRPRSGLQILDFPPPKDKDSQRLVDNLMLMYGARDLAVGVPVLLAWYLDRRALGWLMFVNAIIPCVDAWAAKRQNGKGVWMHLPFAALGVGLGAALLK